MAPFRHMCVVPTMYSTATCLRYSTNPLAPKLPLSLFYEEQAPLTLSPTCPMRGRLRPLLQAALAHLTTTVLVLRALTQCFVVALLASLGRQGLHRKQHALQWLPQLIILLRRLSPLALWITPLDVAVDHFPRLHKAPASRYISPQSSGSTLVLFIALTKLAPTMSSAMTFIMAVGTSTTNNGIIARRQAIHPPLSPPTLHMSLFSCFRSSATSRA